MYQEIDKDKFCLSDLGKNQSFYLHEKFKKFENFVGHPEVKQI